MSIGMIDRAASLSRWRRKPLAEKALAGFGLLALAVTLPPWPGAAYVGGAALGLTFLGARVPFGLWLRVAALPLGFLISGAAMLLVQIGPQGLSLAPGGVEAALHLGLRAMAATFCLMFLALTTPATDLLGGLRRLGLPGEIVEIALLTYRFTFLLAEAASAMTHAQSARLGHATNRLWLRSTARVIAGLLPRAMARARAMEVGLAARGWQGDMPTLALAPPASALRLTFIAALLIALVLLTLFGAGS
jgi:cobalt/nickel transport system permease protein